MPYSPNAEDTPRADAQHAAIIEFLDPWLQADGDPDTSSRVCYYETGSGRWHETPSWPPAGVSRTRWFPAAQGRLSSSPPEDDAGEDRYLVDLQASTGTTNRWHAQMGVPVAYHDRAEADRRLLTYTSEPLRDDLTIAGHPFVHVELRASTEDVAVYVYLESVDESGRVTYLTEGQLRALHRATSTDPPYETFGPAHSFLRKDASPLAIGAPAELDITMFPIAARVARGHRLRLAIAGHDSDSFLRVPADLVPTIWILRNRARTTFIDLPIQRP